MIKKILFVAVIIILSLILVSCQRGDVNRGKLIVQDPEDNTSFMPGEGFTVTWTLENTGSTTWTEQYYIEFDSGEQMHVQDRAFMWLEVPPGTSLPVSIDFVAPQSTGRSVSNWKLYDAEGVPFFNFNISINVTE